MTNRRPFVGGNWKMNTDLASAVELADDIVAEIGNLQEQCDIADGSDRAGSRGGS